MSYIELHCHSNFSLLDGADHPETLVARAAEVGMPALALTDHDALYGAVRFAEAAQRHGIRPIFGAEVTLAGGRHLTLLVENEAGWTNLCRLLTLAQQRAPKGQAALPPAALAGHTAGLIALSGCRQGEIAGALLGRDRAAALRAAHRYRELFGSDHFWLELQHHLRPEDDRLVAELVGLAAQVGLGFVATNNVHYAGRAGRPLQDVLVCIRQRTTLARAGARLRPNSEFYLKTARQLAPLFRAYPQALSNSRLIAERCHFALRYGLQSLPDFPTPAGLEPAAYLRHLCEAALPQRYPDPAERVGRQLDHELAVIGQAGLANYFLIVADIVRFARGQGIRCQGRGSAANSLVAYLLDISPIDPLAHDLVFERFLSAERATRPDIDLDFQADRREEVIQYVYNRYGPAHAAMACTFVTFRSRSAVREVAQVLGQPESAIVEAQERWQMSRERPGETLVARPELTPRLELAQQLYGFPRHLGLHNGGMILTGSPLAERVPTEPAAMPERVVVQWDKADLESVELVKIDILGLRMLSAIGEAVEIIAATTGQAPELERLTFDDPAVYDLIATGSTIGIFQVESRAQAQLQPRLRPTCFADLIVAISLIRPGPIQGNMVHPYLRRRLGLEPVHYAHPLLEPALAETLGVILFQEQVLKVARDLAGFTAGQGEQLRRALGSKQGQAGLERFRADFLAGAQAKGVALATAEHVFEQLRAFGGYAFAKSHAAAFAVLVYQSAWLKRYQPTAFFTALLNNQPMGFWSPAVLVGDARRHGITVRPVDIVASQDKCCVEQKAIRLGFNYVKGFGEASLARLMAARRAAPFVDLAHFCRCSRLPRRLVENLILAGAFDRWGLPRRQLLWQLGQIHYQAEEFTLVFPDEGVDLPPLSALDTLALEHSLLGLSPGEHLLRLYRPALEAQGILGSSALARQPAGQRVRVAGLVVVHQAPPTAKGFHFLTLEDEAGLIDVILRPQIYARQRRLWRNEPLLVVEGLVQRENGLANVLACRGQAFRA
jgi:error-prone DNA polymerase